MRFLVLLALCASAPAVAADQFDLACQGTKLAQRDGTAAPHAFRVRIDLTSQKWCMDSCAAVTDIYETKPDRISLADDIIYNTRSDLSNAVYVDRKTNAFHQLATQDRPTVTYLKIDATCKVETFTPFPAAK